jgi:hypothetical protein
VNIGLDEPVALPKRRREVNLTIDQRYECAALRLLRKSWKEIGARYSNGSTPEQDERAIGAVKKSAMAIIRAARLSVKRNKGKLGYLLDSGDPKM